MVKLNSNSMAILTANRKIQEKAVKKFDIFKNNPFNKILRFEVGNGKLNSSCYGKQKSPGHGK